MNKNFRILFGFIALPIVVFVSAGCGGGGTKTTTAGITCPTAANVTVSTTLTAGVALNGVTLTLNYTGGNGGDYAATTFTLNGITGTLSAGKVATGNGTITIPLTGTPIAAGTSKASLTIGNTTCPEISFTVVAAPTPNPTSAVLTYPTAANANCVSVNNTLTFTWTLGVNTTNVDVYVRQLPNGVTTKVGNVVSTATQQFAIPTSTNATSATNLQNAQPYRVWVVSKNATANTATSDTSSASSNSKFYLSGPAKTAAVPFPADLTAPLNNATAVANPISFSWVGSDADNDISYYELWLQLPGQTVFNKNGQNITASPTTYTSAQASGSIIKWYIRTVDAAGNSSTSDVRSFTTQ